MSIVPERDKNDFELLLHRAELERNMLDEERDIVDNYDYPAERQRSIKGASLEDLARMLSQLVAVSMRKTGTVFNPDEGARLKVDQTSKIEHPYILYHIINCKPKDELKPREREEIMEVSDDENSRRPGRIFGKRFVAIVQFDILASDYRTADKVMNKFEEIVFNYTSYLKENGIAEIFLKQRLTDRDLDIYRQSLSIRSLQYYVEVEKLLAKFDGIVEDIFTVGQTAGSEVTEF